MALHSPWLSNKQINTAERVESELEAQDGRCGRGQGWQGREGVRTLGLDEHREAGWSVMWTLHITVHQRCASTERRAA